jgi:hypothetical protein
MQFEGTVTKSKCSIYNRTGQLYCQEAPRPSGAFRRAITRFWEPWVFWAYGGSFDHHTEEHIPDAGLQLIESRFVADELIKLITARPS